MQFSSPTKIETLELVCICFQHTGDVLQGVLQPAIHFEHHLVYEKAFHRAIYSTVVHMHLLNKEGTEESFRVSFLGRFRVNKYDHKVDEESLYTCISLAIKACVHYLEKNTGMQGSINIHTPSLSKVKPGLTKVLEAAATQ